MQNWPRIPSWRQALFLSFTRPPMAATSTTIFRTRRDKGVRQSFEKLKRPLQRSISLRRGVLTRHTRSALNLPPVDLNTDERFHAKPWWLDGESFFFFSICACGWSTLKKCRENCYLENIFKSRLKKEWKIFLKTSEWYFLNTEILKRD